MRRGAVAAAAAFLSAACLAGPSLAADYPFHGYFATTFDDTSLADGRLACALSFFRQDRDGSFVNYHLDEPRFSGDGTVRYIPYGSGQCTLADDGRIEACRMVTSASPDEIGSVYVDVIESISAEVIDTVTFDDVAAAESWVATGEPAPTDRMRLVRCGFDDEAAAGALEAGMTTLDEEALGRLLNPEMTEENRAAMQAVLDALLAGR